jgi:zinc/manganese transport system substrate-binding protein
MSSVFRRLTALLLALAGSCTAAPLRIATLSTVLTEVARTVGGPDVAVTPILAPGVDPHTFDPSPGDLQALAGADLVLASGLGLENYLSRMAANSGSTGRILEAGSVLAAPVQSGPRAEPDPHWWHSIAAMITVTEWVGRQFSALRPEHARDFSARAAAYVARLETLRAWTRVQLGSLPPGRRGLVTTHDAFGWFARDYAFEVRSIEGLSTESEPDAKGFALLARTVRKLRITCIFPEYGENTNLSESLCRETGAHLGTPLYADGLVPEPDGMTFEAMYRHNVLAIAGGLR